MGPRTRNPTLVAISPTRGADTTLEVFLEPELDIKDEQPLDVFGDLDLDIENFVKLEPPPSEVSLGGSSVSTHPVPIGETNNGVIESPDADPQSRWNSHSQPVTFRKTAAKVADDFLKYKGAKLRKGPARFIAVRDEGAYKQAKEDGNKTDVHWKGILESIVCGGTKLHFLMFAVNWKSCTPFSLHVSVNIVRCRSCSRK